MMGKALQSTSLNSSQEILAKWKKEKYITLNYLGANLLISLRCEISLQQILSNQMRQRCNTNPITDDFSLSALTTKIYQNIHFNRI